MGGCLLSGTDVPHNDLRLYQTLLRYRSIDEEIADAAIGRHTGYLKPEIIPLSLASDAVSDADKAAIASALLTNTTPEEDDDAVLRVDEHTLL